MKRMGHATCNAVRFISTTRQPLSVTCIGFQLAPDVVWAEKEQ